MEIRELNAGDLESLLKLYVQLDPQNGQYSPEKSRAIWEQIARSQNIKYIGAIENGQVVSTCYLVIIPNLTRNGRSIGFIENVVTNEKYRKRGIGKRIIEAAVAIAKREDCFKVILQSGVQRTAAHEFYRKIGFSDTTKKAFDMRL